MIKSIEGLAKIMLINGDKIFAAFNICGGAYDTDKFQCKDDKCNENGQRQIILEVL